MDAQERQRLREAWEAWRAPRSEKLAGTLWPMLQRLGEANKAGLLLEAGSGAGGLAVALSRRVAWRDLLALEGHSGWLREGAAAVSGDPALHRLDFGRTLALGAESPRLPLWPGTVSGTLALGTLGLARDPKGLLADFLRVARPGSPLLLAEPVGALLGDGAKIPRELRRPDSWLDGLAKDAEGLQVLGREKKMGLRFVLARKAGAAGESA